MSSFLKGLTQPQRAAAEHIEGPMLILAGPGSGKTRVVTHRIAHLMYAGVQARHILGLTFTNKSASEMKSRVETLVPGESVWISTFHRFCSRLLREHATMVGLAENFTIYDMADSSRALKHALAGLTDLNLDQIAPSKLQYAISHCKNQLVTADSYQPTSRSKMAVLLADVYPAYQRQLIIANAVDFDDLLLHTVELLRNNDELRRELDERYQYVMVDEYQDTNLAQYAIVRSLCIDHPNLAVTGDPDQSIYGWRGADIKNILGFERDYPKVTVVRLEHNFRSTPQILSVADRLIQFNKQRKAKSLIPVRDNLLPVNLLAFPSQQDEARHIAEEIKRLVRKGERQYKDFAIFYRINALSRYLEHTLSEYKIPYQIMNGVEFYQRSEVKDVMAYLQLINNPRDDMAFLRVVNVPGRGIGKVSLAKLSDHARAHRLCLLDAAREAASTGVSRRAVKSLVQFAEMIDDFQRLAASPVEEILGHVLSRTGYAESVKDKDLRADEDRHANIRELLTAARQFDLLHQGADYLEAFLEQTALTSDTDAWEDELNKVTLMTLHASKGLEFPVVYMVAVEHGKLPHERSREDPAQMEEERRLMFVGITRAEDALSICYAKYRDFRGQLSPTVPSSFLQELPLDEMNVVRPMERHQQPFTGDEYLNDVDELPEDALEFDIDAFEDADDVLQSSDESSSGSSSASSSEPEILPETQASQEVVLSQLTTAAAMADEPEVQPTPSVPTDPNIFAQGMRVSHPEYGLGKIVAISGAGKKRTATVAFVLHGSKSIILYYSELKPS